MALEFGEVGCQTLERLLQAIEAVVHSRILRNPQADSAQELRRVKRPELFFPCLAAITQGLCRQLLQLLLDAIDFLVILSRWV